MPETPQQVDPNTESTNQEEPKSEAEIQEEPASPGQKNAVKIILIIIGALIILGMITALAFGWLGAKIGKSIIDEATDGRVNVSDESVTIQGDDDESYEFKAEQELAHDFPTEVPLYEPTELVSSARTKQDGDTAWSVNFKTDDSQTAVFVYYEDALSRNGWDVQSSFESGEMSSIGADNESAGLQLQVNILTDSDNDTTLISLNVFKPNE